MRYLKGTLVMRLRIGSKHIKLKGYCDVDWTGDVEKFRFLDTFSLLERGSCRGIANDNNR